MSSSAMSHPIYLDRSMTDLIRVYMPPCGETLDMSYSRSIKMNKKSIATAQLQSPKRNRPSAGKTRDMDFIQLLEQKYCNLHVDLDNRNLLGDNEDDVDSYYDDNDSLIDDSDMFTEFQRQIVSSNGNKHSSEFVSFDASDVSGLNEVALTPSRRKRGRPKKDSSMTNNNNKRKLIGDGNEKKKKKKLTNSEVPSTPVSSQLADGRYIVSERYMSQDEEMKRKIQSFFADAMKDMSSITSLQATESNLYQKLSNQDFKEIHMSKLLSSHRMLHVDNCKLTETTLGLDDSAKLELSEAVCWKCLVSNWQRGLIITLSQVLCRMRDGNASYKNCLANLMAQTKIGFQQYLKKQWDVWSNLKNILDNDDEDDEEEEEDLHKYDDLTRYLVSNPLLSYDVLFIESERDLYLEQYRVINQLLVTAMESEDDLITSERRFCDSLFEFISVNATLPAVDDTEERTTLPVIELKRIAKSNGRTCMKLDNPNALLSPVETESRNLRMTRACAVAANVRMTQICTIERSKKIRRNDKITTTSQVIEPKIEKLLLSRPFKSTEFHEPDVFNWDDFK